MVIRIARWIGLAAVFVCGAAEAQDAPPTAPAATADSATAAGSVRRDPRGVTGISPFWEALKKGDDAFVARDLDGAQAAYQEAIRREPQNPLGHYRMGEAHLAKGELAEAQTVWEAAKRFALRDQTLKGKILFVLADLQERQRAFAEATTAWNSYEAHANSQPSAKTFLQTASDRKKRIAEWKQMEEGYAAVKERIAKRLEEAEKKSRSGK